MAEDWKDEARRRLVGDANARLELGHLICEDELPNIPCVLPWHRLEISTVGIVGPCCADFQGDQRRESRPLDITALWQGDRMRAFREAMFNPAQTICAAHCPVLAGRSHPPARFRFTGGPEAFVEHQIALAESMLAGSEDAGSHPVDLMFPPTTFCNYDCLMCNWGEDGTLDDELGSDFYAGLTPMLPTLRALEAAGGEPLASPAFREFLETIDFETYPQLRVSLVTNGSYLSARQLDRYERVPFSTVTISMNAASAETYDKVNRGVAWDRIRSNLDALKTRRAAGKFRGSVAYSMVVLRSNVHEIGELAALAEADDVNVRYMLPMFNRNRESIMVDAQAMQQAADALERVAQRQIERGQPNRARDIRGELEVLQDRLNRGLFIPMPNGMHEPPSLG